MLHVYLAFPTTISVLWTKDIEPIYKKPKPRKIYKYSQVDRDIIRAKDKSLSDTIIGGIKEVKQHGPCLETVIQKKKYHLKRSHKDLTYLGLTTI